MKEWVKVGLLFFGLIFMRRWCMCDHYLLFSLSPFFWNRKIRARLRIIENGIDGWAWDGWMVKGCMAEWWGFGGITLVLIGDRYYDEWVWFYLLLFLRGVLWMRWWVSMRIWDLECLLCHRRPPRPQTRSIVFGVVSEVSSPVLSNTAR